MLEQSRFAVLRPHGALRPFRTHHRDGVTAFRADSKWMMTMTVTTLTNLNALISRVKSAQARFAEYPQEKVDLIFRSAALAAADARIPLA
ncbi:MAG: hypothetical protein ACLGJC_30300, partial [Alphaproteobacteria bacterium]